MTLVRVPVPWRGQDLSSEPDTLAAGQGTLVRNLLPGRQGQLVPRGPVNKTTTTRTTDKAIASTGAGGFWISPDDPGAHYLQQAGTVATVSRDGAAPFALPAGGYIMPSHVRMGTYTVGCTGVAPRNLVTWDGNTTVVSLTNGPANVEAVAGHLNRVFALSGTSLFWTDPNPTNLPSNLAATWQDDVTGLTNTIPLPVGDSYREILTFNRVLYIIGSQAVYALMGDTPASFVLRKVLDISASNYAVPSGHAAASARGIYFQTASGIVRFDGAVPQTVSQEIAPLLATAWTRIAAIGDDFISVIAAGSWLLYHEPTGAWCSLTSAIFPYSEDHGAAGLPSFVRRTGSQWTAFSVGTASAGASASFPLNPDAAQQLAQLGTAAWADSGVTPIDAQAVSASIRLSGPDRMASLQRLHAQAGCGGWTVQVEDEAGVAIGPPATLVTGTKRARAEAAPGFTENDIVRVRWTWSGTVGVRMPSIGDAHLLVDSAQQR